MFTYDQIGDALLSYAFQGINIYRDSIWLYAIPAIYKRPADKNDEFLVDELIAQLLDDDWLLLTEHSGVYLRSEKLVNLLKTNKVIL